MLKLLKYELLSSYRQFFATFTIFLVLSLATPFLPKQISNILTGLLMCAVFGISMAVQVNICLNYNKSMFKQPGYLTLTLPVSTTKVVLAKIISSFIWNIVATIVLGIGLVLMTGVLGYVNIFEFFDILFKSIGQFLSYATFDTYMDLLLSLLFLLSSLLLFLISVYCVISFTHTKYVPKYKFVIGIIVYVVLCTLFSMFLDSDLICMIIVPLSYQMSMLMGSILFIVIGVGLFALNNYFINYKIEIE